MVIPTPFTRLNAVSGLMEVYCSQCGYLPPSEFQPGNVKIHKALCAKCSREQCKARYKKRTVLEMFKRTIKARLVKFDMNEQVKTITNDFVRDILVAGGLKVQYSTLAANWELEHVQVFPPRHKANFHIPDKWIVVVLDEYYGYRKKSNKRKLCI